MKKNGLQIMTLVLCAVLLCSLVGLHRKLEETESRLNHELQTLERAMEQLPADMQRRMESALEETSAAVADYVLEPTRLDKASRSLLADVSVTLKEWHEDTEVTLLAMVGEKDVSLPMEADGSGGFTGQLSLPVEGAVWLNVSVSGGGLTRREELGGWDDVSMLLPLQHSGGGWDGPVYQQGILSSQFHITVRGQDQMPGLITEPRFRVYQNGELAQELDAVIDPGASASDGVCYTVDAENYRWSMECAPGDTVEIHFLCRDEYGLGYDFYFQGWAIGADGQVEEYYTPEGESLVLSWD